jgi:uncharacterized damage-inducible protein DinB
MITTDQLAEGFALNLRLMKRQCEGLSHAESLIQTPYNINCLNWVLGHLAVNRDRLLRLIGEEPLLSEDQFNRYKTESDPVKEDGEDVIKLERLLEILIEGQERINNAFSQLTDEQLVGLVQVGEHQMPLGVRLHGYYFHDTYHTGQTDLLRQIAGTNDKIV